MRRCLAATLALALSLGFAGSVFAATPDASDIEYQRLKARIAQLKQEIGTLQADNKEIIKNEKKNTKAIKVAGDMRVKWIDQHDGQGTTLTESVKLRTKYSINKDLMFNASFMFMADNPFGTTNRQTGGNIDTTWTQERFDDFSAADNVAVSHLNVKQSHFLGNNSITVGRMGHSLGATKYWADETANGYFDGVQLGFGPKENIAIAYGNWGAADTYGKYWNTVKATWPEKHKDLENAYLIKARQKLDDKTTLYEWILNEVGEGGYKNEFDLGNTYEMRGIGLKTKLSSDISLAADYTKNLDQKADGIFVRFKYKGASRHVPGSYGIGLDYERIEPGNLYSTQLNGVNDVSLGWREEAGIDTAILWGQYTFRKNVIMSVYQSIYRKAMVDYKSDTKFVDFTAGESISPYTRAHIVWYF